MLTRYACYLIVQNVDSKKEGIAFSKVKLQVNKSEICHLSCVLPISNVYLQLLIGNI